MTAGKDSAQVVSFMVQFQRLRDLLADDPSELLARASKDEALKELCIGILSVANELRFSERRNQRSFVAPVDPAFIAAWRAYERRYEPHVLDIYLPDVDPAEDEKRVRNRVHPDIVWQETDRWAEELRSALDISLQFAFASAQAVEHWDGYDGDLEDKTEDSVDAFIELNLAARNDLRGIFRRRALVPFVLVPRHVAQHHGDGEKLSLHTQLEEAHGAFVFGLHFAALALMRSVLETTLKVHYRTPGNDLKERIGNCQNLPRGTSIQSLDRVRKLANNVLHFERNGKQVPSDFEREVLRLLNALRALIEGAPVRGKGK